MKKDFSESLRRDEQLGLNTDFTYLGHQRAPKFYEDEKGTGFPHV